MRWFPLILAPLLLQDPADEIFVGKVARAGDGWLLTVEGEETPLAIRGYNPAPVKGKRVQAIGVRDENGIRVKTLDELNSPDRDLVLRIKAKAKRVKVMEYLPVPTHIKTHPGRTCRIHAWARTTIEATDGAVRAEVKVPSYATRPHVRIFIRAEGADEGAEPTDTGDFVHDGRDWRDKDLAVVEGPADVEVEAP